MVNFDTRTLQIGETLLIENGKPVKGTLTLFIDEYAFGSTRKSVNWENVTCEQGTVKVKAFLRTVDKPSVIFCHGGQRSTQYVLEPGQMDALLAKVKEFADTVRNERLAKEEKLRKEEEEKQRQLAEEQRIRLESQRKAEEEYRRKQEEERRQKEDQERKEREAMERRIADKQARIKREVEACKSKPDESVSIEVISKKAGAAFLDNPYRILGVSCMATNEEVNTPTVEEDTPQLEVQEYTNQNIARGDEAIANQDYITAFNAYLSVSESDADYQVAYDRIHEHLGTYVNHVKDLKNEAQNEPNYDHYVDVIYQMDDANNILNQMLDYYPDFYEEYSDEMIYVTAETENSMANWSIDRAAEYTTARDFDSAQDLLWKVKQYIVSRPSSQYHDEFIPFYLPRYSKAYAMNEIQRAANMGAQGYGASDIAYTLRDAISESDYYGYLIELYEHYAHDAGMLYPYNAYKNGNNFILPESDSREYSYGEISNFNLTELRMARFEIYARHNRKFADPTVQKYFDGKVWYSGQIEAASFDESSLSEIEKANIRTIFACEMDLGYFR